MSKMGCGYSKVKHSTNKKGCSTVMMRPFHLQLLSKALSGVVKKLEKEAPEPSLVNSLVAIHVSYNMYKREILCFEQLITVRPSILESENLKTRSSTGSTVVSNDFHTFDCSIHCSYFLRTAFTLTEQ